MLIQGGTVKVDFLATVASGVRLQEILKKLI